MISKEKLNIEWINHVSKTNRNADKILIEKVIRALLLLEGLVQSNLDFVFKGGTALMLHLNSAKRLSIDIDIIIEKISDDLDSILEKVALNQGFNKVELQKRNSNSNIVKAHYKFFYNPIHKTSKEEEYILLDILFDTVSYEELVNIPIQSNFLPSDDNNITVLVPSLEDLLGDKLTAFAPNTTGIPYYKGEDSMSMEIIKQLYDIGNLFDVCSDLEIIKKTFIKFSETELAYRQDLNKVSMNVLDDIYQTSLSICSRGLLGEGNFEELQLGIKRIAGFIFSESFHIDKAIIAASKAAYLSVLISANSNDIEKFSSPLDIQDMMIANTELSKLNKLKKSNPEAFFYWYKINKLIS